MNSSASKDSTEIVLKGSAVVVQGLLVLGTAIPIIGQFAVVLQNALEVIKQASRNEDAILKLHDHALNISEGLLHDLSGISSTSPGFDNALNKLIDLLTNISTYISNHKSLVTKAISATDTNLVTEVDNYMKDLTECEGGLMALINIDTNRKVTDNAEAKRNSKDDFFHSASFKEDNSRSLVNQDVEESLTDEKAISKNAQESKYSNK